MKVIEVNMEIPHSGSSQNQSEEGEISDSNKTEMSFRDINPDEQVQSNNA
jgi:hypothetical protein